MLSLLEKKETNSMMISQIASSQIKFRVFKSLLEKPFTRRLIFKKNYLQDNSAF